MSLTTDAAATTQVPHELLAVFRGYIDRERALSRLVQVADERLAELDDRRAHMVEQLAIQHCGLSVDVIESVVGLAFTAMPNPGSGQSTVDSDAIEKSVQVVLRNLPEGYELEALIFDAARVMAEQQPARPLLFSALLTSFVGSFESFVADLARLLFGRFPGTLDMSQRKYAWDEIAGYRTLDDLRAAANEDAVVNLMRGSLESWLAHFVSKHKIKMNVTAADERVREVFQRRHAIVHNSGKASRLYIDKCGLEDPPELGSTLSVDADYLRHAADALTALAFDLAWQIAHKVVKEEELRAFESYAANVPYRLLLENRYSAVELLAAAALACPAESETAALVAQVNYWLAKKRLGRFDECRAEVEAWSTAILSDQYRLARLALLDELEEGLALVRKIRGTDKLPIHFWLSWPLLAELRQYEVETAPLPD